MSVRGKRIWEDVVVLLPSAVYQMVYRGGMNNLNIRLPRVLLRGLTSKARLCAIGVPSSTQRVGITIHIEVILEVNIAAIAELLLHL